MGKQVRYKFRYINNSENVMLSWDAKAGANTEYRVYSAEGGKSALINSTKETRLVFPAKGVSTVYVEARTVAGGYISESQKLDIPVNTDDIIGIKAIKSYKGVTLVWSEKTLCSIYNILKKDGRDFIKTERKSIALHNCETIKKRETLRITEINNSQDILRLSGDFVLTEDSCEKIEAPDDVKLSVIIPAYNNEIFLPSCVDAVLASTMKELEIIIVDDGSSDKTGEIADWYAENYKGKVIAVHTENRGPAAARNEGVKHARGEYAAFADSDDIVSSDMYRELYSSAEKLGCDIAVCPYFIVLVAQMNVTNIITDSALPFEADRAYNAEDFLKVLRLPGCTSMSVCNRIYRTELLKRYPIPQLAFEDSSWIPLIFSQAKTFCYVNRPLYCYNRLVEAHKKTLSTINSKLTETEFAERALISYNYFLENGNPEKKEYLLAVALRCALDHLSKTDPKETDAAKLYIDFLTAHADALKSVKFIADDRYITETLAKARRKFGFDI